jgi:phosphatidylserine decarboxylase
MTFPPARLQYLLPRASLTALAGRLADCRVRWVKNALIRASVAAFGIDLRDAATADPEAYPCFNDFFARPLRPGARPVCPRPDFLVSPADGAVSALGPVAHGRLLQAKGRDYSLLALLGGDVELARQHEASHYVTLYLSPRDYHRVHWPREARLRSTAYVPGDLFSVNPATAAAVPGLFARNERLIVAADTAEGPLAVILVGAMIVAGIRTVWRPEGYARHGVQRQADFPRRDFPAGAELGRFTMGSTVIVLQGGATPAWEPALREGARVRFGEALARLTPVPRES